MSRNFVARAQASGTLSSVACLGFAVVSFSFSQPARAQAGAIYGGAGGHYFEYSCGPDRVLVGLRGSAGVLLDSIQPMCASVDARNLATGSSYGPVFGGDRPIDNSVQCPVPYAVTDAYMARNESNPYLGAIRLICTELVQRDGGGQRAIEIRGTGHFEGYDSPFGLVGGYEGSLTGASNCAGGYASGIRGRSDRYVDAFGLMCGPKPAAIATGSTEGRTLGKRKKPKVDLGKDASDSYESSIPQTQRTLGKRKRPAPTGGAGSEQNPNPTPEQPGGVSIFTDSVNLGAAPSPNEPTAPVPPSPLINGTYSTRLQVTESRCLQDNLRGTWQRDLELTPQPGILIPLNEFNQMFAGPVMLQVQGLILSQSTNISVKFGLTSEVPATFNGAFAADGSTFKVQFEAGNALCRIAGTISGMRL
ncbi:hypothetical protein [Sphingomonas hankyongi]|uniref:Uncharacterized protein n=1 Tax=Sphingomonas hankyongi TaxID=2908209 RepID=A0ABT0RZ86_9SPHN|nr:hypothetical protein [Sphingomonas hankyongi]MCL6728706.1 hypothetical protein [Sphingomonas hankyongi]